MPGRGNHRRPRTNPLIRGVVAAGTGGAALTLPLLGATAANAAQPPRIAQTTVQSAAQAVQTPRPLTYTVVKGDTLYRIAKTHDVRGGWRQLYEDNRAAVGDDPGLIHPGLELQVKTAKAKAGDTAGTTDAEGTADTTDAEGAADAQAGTAAGPAAKAAGSVADAVPVAAKTYPDNLDGWIREALDIMAQHGIPGTYEGIHRNIMRESSGNPLAVNNWDSNAAAGTPSKGLLQVIDPTFQAYHVPGTSWDPFDPVANITAACNYAAQRYGSIDNVNGPY
ncbi:LysM peptidoglycan-binding domain-containing protein [Streptomyces sp. NPDC052701]|uniref:transglycosylase SLT domain-containing protein n=1 Tax=Streptomyces sp. NPDC052701 TaxID=3155533 RepID=UPI00342755D7